MTEKKAGSIIQAPELTLVMPVYNEEGAIEEAIREWTSALDELHIDYECRILNDGSKDDTAGKLDSIASGNPRIVITHKKNSGHGPTILQGYRESRGEWVFQTDSDRELPPDAFKEAWASRSDADYLQGYRVQRVAPPLRKLTTAVAALTVRMMFGPGLRDINCPYRLMKGEWLRKVADEIPPDTLTPNVVLSGWAVRDHLRLREVPVEHSHRQTGEVSIKRWKLCKFATKAFFQVLRLKSGGAGASKG